MSSCWLFMMFHVVWGCELRPEFISINLLIGVSGLRPACNVLLVSHFNKLTAIFLQWLEKLQTPIISGHAYMYMYIVLNNHSHHTYHVPVFYLVSKL